MGNHLIGMLAKSPAVITEAIWGLAFQLEELVLLESVELIWTEGTNQQAMTLLGPDGALAALKRDYPGQMAWDLPRLGQSERCTVIDIDDVTTAEEARRAANSIYDHLRQSIARHRESDDTVHVVMAGGRKTMAGLMMTAFQLLARSGDHLWHVALHVEPRELPQGFFYPRPDDPPELQRVFSLHEVPCLLLGRQVAAAGLELDRPFDEILTDIQHRLELSRLPPRLVIDLVEGRVTFKDVELRPEKKKNSLALLALLAWQREHGDGWIAAGNNVRWQWQQVFQFLRFRQILESRGRVDRIGRLDLKGQICEVAASVGIEPFDPELPPNTLNEALEECARDCGKWASELDRAARRASPPVDPFLESNSRVGAGGDGRYRRIMPAADVELRLIG